MISVIIPFHNEKENLPILFKKLQSELDKISEDYEVILVDDGSTDAVASKFQVPNSKFRVLQQRKRMGKGKALATGFEASKGDIIVFMDADLQDDPQDFSKFLNKLKEGYDFVNGWRKDRKDGLSKTVPSRIFNSFILKPLLRTQLHDINCGYKAMRRQILEEIPLYGDNYRFLPFIAEREGFGTTEVIVNHHFRLHGKSKYGFRRLFFGLFDTITTYFIYRFSEKPLHFFAPIGGLSFLIGTVITLNLAIQRLFFGQLLYRRPALQLAILLIIVGIQIVMTGVLGELIVYLNKKNSKPQIPNSK